MNALRAPRPGTTLRRRLMRLVLLATPALWALSMLLSFLIAHQEIDELFDAELVRVAQQLAGALPEEAAAAGVAASVPFAPRRPAIHDGGSDVKDLLVVVWDRAGNRLPVAGRAANLLPHRPGLHGFVDLDLRGLPARC